MPFSPSRFAIAVAFVAAACVSASFVPAKPHKPMASAMVYIDMGTKTVLKPNDDGEMEVHVEHAHGTGESIGGGYVITAAHVADSDEGLKGGLKAIDSLGKEHTLEVLWANHKYDVALLRISDPSTVGSEHLSCRFLHLGEHLSFQGHPFDLNDITTWGVIANANIVNTGPWAAVNTVNGNIDPGMSGGPVFDRGHEVVGVNVGTIQGSGLGFIVPGRVICNLMGR